MPELPEVETIRRSLHDHVVQRVIVGVDVRSPKLRQPIAPNLARALTGRRIVDSGRRGKYLFFSLDTVHSEAWIFHMGMSGRLTYRASARSLSLGKHDHIVAHLDDGGCLVFRDPRKFGLCFLDDPMTCRPFVEMGPEPLDATVFDEDYLWGVRRRTRRCVKDVLMDQHVVAGLGNIYVNEILFVAGLRPRKRLDRVNRSQMSTLVASVREIISEAIEHRGSSISDFLDGIGEPGGYQWRHRVYGRGGQPCPRCRTTIKTVVVAQRASFYCPNCQS